MTARDHGELAGLELEVRRHLTCGEVELDGIMYLDVGIDEANGAAVVRRRVRNGRGLTDMKRVTTDRRLTAATDTSNAQQLVRRFLRRYAGAARSGL